MINVSVQIRRAVLEDQLQIANLIHNEVTSHRHLDWRIPLEWIGSPNYWVMEEDGRHITGVLACPEDPPQVAWIRLFAYSPHTIHSFVVPGQGQIGKQPEAWSALWEAARGEVAGPGRDRGPRAGGVCRARPRGAPRLPRAGS